MRQRGPFLLDCDVATVIHATVSCRLEYFKSLYSGQPLRLIQKLQLVQNVVVWVLMGTPRTVHTQIMLRQLHWLPVEYRVKFKVLVLISKALNGLGSSYLWDCLLQYVSRRALWIITCWLKRTFMALAPAKYNSLLYSIMAPWDLTQSCRAVVTPGGGALVSSMSWARVFLMFWLSPLFTIACPLW